MYFYLQNRNNPRFNPFFSRGRDNSGKQCLGNDRDTFLLVGDIPNPLKLSENLTELRPTLWC